MITSIRKLFDKRNLLAITTVFIGILGIFDIPQNLGVPTDKLILGLLGFIALEAVIINIGYMEDIQNTITKLDAKISQPNIDEIIGPQAGRFDFAISSQDATNILVCGISLASFIMSEATLLRQLATKGCRLNFAFTDLDVPFLGYYDVNTPVHLNEEVAKSDIRGGMSRLAQIYNSLDGTHRKNIEARSCAGIPHFSGMRILTKSKSTDTTWITFFSYGQSAGSRRNLLLTPTTSPETYKYYTASLEDVWKASKTIDLSKLG